MKNRKRRHTKNKSGATLVELVVSILIFSILMAMIAAVIRPASKIFVRMQKLQYAQAILDNTIQELRGIVLEASPGGYVKIYESCDADTDLTAASGSGQGAALEFVNTDGYVFLISADGCPETDVYLGSFVLDTVAENDIPKGRLLVRYYVSTGGVSYSYQDETGKKKARAVNPVFTDGYYMGNYLELSFSYPDTPDKTEEDEEGNTLSYYQYLQAELRLYGDPERTQLILQDSVVLDFRGPTLRQDKITAQTEYK